MKGNELSLILDKSEAHILDCAISNYFTSKEGWWEELNYRKANLKDRKTLYTTYSFERTYLLFQLSNHFFEFHHPSFLSISRCLGSDTILQFSEIKKKTE